MRVINNSDKCNKSSIQLPKYYPHNQSDENRSREWFSGFFEVLPIPSPVSPTLFWSASGFSDFSVEDLQANLSDHAADKGVNLTTSSTLECAKIIDHMEKREEECSIPKWWGAAGCSDTLRKLFWTAVSRTLAENSEGIVFYLTPGVYNTTNYFGSVELPVILSNASRVQRFIVLNVRNTTKCGDPRGQLEYLKKRTESDRPSLNYSCIDANPNVAELFEIIKRAIYKD